MEGVQTMFAKFIDVIQTFLTEPAILIGILVGVGYALDKDAYKNYHRYDQRDGRFDDGVIWRLSIFSHF